MNVQGATLALVAGIAMASNYMFQPLLPAIAASFPGTPWATGLIAGAPQLGYMLGLLLLVPLADRRDARRLVLLQLGGLSLALLIETAARSALMLVAACAIAGMLATVAAQCVALGARLGEARRGRTVGTIAMGIGLGILGGRVAGGALGSALGWRAVPLLVAALALGMAVLVRGTLPSFRPEALPGETGSMLRVFAKAPGLTGMTLTGACWFASFSGFWATLALHLAQPPLSFGAGVAGAFGLIGICGAIAANLSGRLVDRLGATPVVAGGMIVAVGGFSVLLAAPRALAAMTAGTFLIDIGCFAAQAANQVRVFGAGGTRPGRAYSAYMVVYYGAGAAGAVAGPALFEAGGWQAACTAWLAVVALGLFVALAQWRAARLSVA